MTDQRIASPVHVACLCAAWCRVCEGYQAVFDEVRRGWAGPEAHIHWHWIDLEDESERVGDLDIETFPMLLVADAQGVRFAGPITMTGAMALGTTCRAMRRASESPASQAAST